MSTATVVLEPAAVADFHAHLAQSKRIVVVIGAGLSASSGLATFRGMNGLWRNQAVESIATPAGWRHDPGLVWQFYSYRREEALKAEPNPAHRALAVLAQKIPGCVMLTQNVDNLSRRAGHPEAQLKELHGNLFDLSCDDVVGCGHIERQNFKNPLTPQLDTSRREGAVVAQIDGKNRPRASLLLLAGIAKKNAKIMGDGYDGAEPVTTDVEPLRHVAGDNDLAVDHKKERKAAVPLCARLSSGLTKEDLPQCPKCKANIMRPQVVWFGETLPKDVCDYVDELFEAEEPIDLCMVIGTTAKVWPAAGYATAARKKGARVAVVNLEREDAEKNVVPGRDWSFIGDAAVIVPCLLKPIVTDV